uniref:GRAM domain-containing protein n=1 Tax=Palpitomonas bilix TaxID=652834 RepID=A0A7S3CYA5_9EUKA|mmetsp:Transcript_14626/g.37356  ORF Transcript_14626/g.37356 Transcript_14626/m.37356 type:complete len:205 (+) Transcript_14626:269-883(+)
MKNGWETPTHGNTVPVQTEAPARISCLYCGKATTWLPALRSAHIVLLYLALLDTAAWMALNPPCDTSGRPFPLEGETFVLLRKSLSLETKIVGTSLKIKGRGLLFLTSHRIVFVLEGRNIPVRAVDFPLHLMHEEEFKQPIFGANKLVGVVQALPGSGLIEGLSFTIKFNDGGCGTFLGLFHPLVAYARALNVETVAEPIQGMM